MRTVQDSHGERIYAYRDLCTSFQGSNAVLQQIDVALL